MSELSRKPFALAVLRVASARVRLLLAEIDELRVFLQDDLIAADAAIELAADLGVLDFVNEIPAKETA